ncbi:hypothetical protein, partial [Burkholderia cenocepacia]|uniref:hypothetical protein n=1 Tax=Burkholderia cenocepacia TaxID=95486 RepID=UPI001BA698D3
MLAPLFFWDWNFLTAIFGRIRPTQNRQRYTSLETVSKRPRGAVNFRGELLTSGIGTTETEEMAKPIIDDELWT